MEKTGSSKLQTLKECRNQIIAASVATIGSFGTGTVFGWSAVAIDTIREDFTKKDGSVVVTANDISWVTSLAIFGAFLGGPLAGFIMDRLGRRTAMLIFSVPFFIGWIIMVSAFAFKPNGFFLLFIGRMLTGMCAGSYLVIVPTYIKEASSDEMRGILGAAVPLLLVTGILYEFVIGAFCRWHITTACCAIVPVCLALGTFFIPESPRILVVKNKMEKAAASVKWLNRIESGDVAKEKLFQIMAEAGYNNKNDKTKQFGLCSRPVVLPVFIIVIVIFFQQFGGVNAVTLYTNDIFASANEGDSKGSLEPRYAIIVIGVVQVVFVIAAMSLVDVLGRKMLLMSCSFLMGLSLIGLGAFFYLKEKGEGEEKSVTWLPIASVCMYMAAYSTGVGSIPWVLATEIYNPDYRAESASVMTSSYWIFGFIVAKIYEDVKLSLRESGSFWLYGGFCIGGSVFAAFFVPETKGRSSEEILRHFGGRSIPSNNTAIVAGSGDSIGFDPSASLIPLVESQTLNLSVETVATATEQNITVEKKESV